MQSILREIRSNEVDEEARSYINVRRSQLWADSCRHLKKSKFNPKAEVSIKFADSSGSSEGAIDAGGPRREYFRLLVRAVNLEAGIFCGPEYSRVIFPNATGTFIERRGDSIRVSPVGHNCNEQSITVPFLFTRVKGHFVLQINYRTTLVVYYVITHGLFLHCEAVRYHAQICLPFV